MMMAVPRARRMMLRCGAGVVEYKRQSNRKVCPRGLNMWLKNLLRTPACALGVFLLRLVVLNVWNVGEDY